MADPAPALTYAGYGALLSPHAVPGLEARRLGPDAFWQAVESTLRQGPLSVEEIGQSVQGRPLKAVSYGAGTTGVLLWSQMHGDEATATRALADLLAFLAAADHPVTQRLSHRLRITIVPMVNPDGAEVHQRENADGVDLNRDAGRVVSPEARALEDLRARTAPAFGFNLHDQDVRRLAGPEGDQVAIALLAPAADPACQWPPTRDRARRLAAVMAAGLREAMPRQVARWTDEFDPRAFGEHMQMAGTSTVLVEAGALPDDPEKEALRRHYGTLLLLALDAVATERWTGADPNDYDHLPLNHAVDHDVHVVGGTVMVAGREVLADVALSFDDPVARTGARLAELGDLGGAMTLERVDARGKWLVLTPQRERSPGVIAPEDRVVAELRDGPEGPTIRAF